MTLLLLALVVLSGASDLSHARNLRLGDNESVPINPIAAAESYRVLIERNETGIVDKALNALGEMYMYAELSYNMDDNLLKARESFEAAANLGNPSAQHHLANMYHLGLGVEQDTPKAVLFDYFSALGGSQRASMSLGYRHLYGVGVPENCDTSWNYYAAVGDLVVTLSGLPAGLPVTDNVNLHTEKLESHKTESDSDVVDYYTNTAENGDVNAQLVLGHIHRFGARGVPRNFDTAAAFYERAAQQGDPAAHAQLGNMHLEGLGYAQNNDTARKHFEIAAAQKNPLALFSLGFMNLNGVGMEKNEKKALSYFKQASEGGHAEAQFALGTMYYQGSEAVDQNYDTAFHYWKLASQKHHVKAMYNLAQMYTNGIGVKRSCKSGTALMKSVAELGPWSVAIDSAYDHFDEGDYEQALIGYTELAMEGHKVAQINAAMMFQNQLGYNANNSRSIAMIILEEAMRQGDSDSARIIGDFYYEGLVNGTVDYPLAVKYYRDASDALDPEALFNLGYMHQHGLGVTRDFHMAKRFYDRSLDVSIYSYFPCTIALALLWVHAWWAGDTTAPLPTTTPTSMSTITYLFNVWENYEDAILALLAGALAVVIFIRHHN